MDSLDSGLSIAELKFELPVVTTTAFAHYRGIEEHVENDNHEIYGNPRNTGRRGQQGEAKTITAMATLLKYKKRAKTSNSGVERNAIRYMGPSAQ